MVSHGKHQLASMGELADGESHAIPCLPPAARALHFTGVMTEGSFRPPREQAWLLSLSGHAAEEIPGLIQNKILLRGPVAVASVKRTFSKLKILKNFKIQMIHEVMN